MTKVDLRPAVNFKTYCSPPFNGLGKAAKMRYWGGLSKDHNDSHGGKTLATWYWRARFPFINFPSRSANSVSYPSSALAWPSGRVKSANPTGSHLSAPWTFLAFKVKLNGKDEKGGSSSFITGFPKEECRASAWFWTLVCVTSTLIWACWNDGAAAANGPKRRIKGMARYILDFRQMILDLSQSLKGYLSR